MVGGTTMRRTLSASVLLSFLSGALGGASLWTKLTTRFQLDSCEAFAGELKPNTTLAFCEAIVNLARFEEDPPICNVPASSCRKVSRRSLLEDTYEYSATIVQEGTFLGFSATEVQQLVTQALQSTTTFQEEVVRILKRNGLKTLADFVQRLAFGNAFPEAVGEEDPPENDCDDLKPCVDYQEPLCLKDDVPFTCVECLGTNDCGPEELCVDYACQS